MGGDEKRMLEDEGCILYGEGVTIWPLCDKGTDWGGEGRFGMLRESLATAGGVKSDVKPGGTGDAKFEFVDIFVA